MRPFSSNALQSLPALFCVVGLVAGLSACDGSGEPVGEEATELSAAERIDVWPTLDALSAALDSAGLAEELQGEGPFTVLAPRLGDVEADSLLNRPQLLEEVLRQHIVTGEALTVDEIRSQEALAAMGGGELQVTTPDDTTTRVNGATIRERNISATNGVVHVIDRTLLEGQDLATRVTFTSDFSALEDALAAAGLMDRLRGDGPLTLLAPSDRALQTLPGDSLDVLLRLENRDRLVEILEYHLVPAEVRAQDISDGMQRTTLEGGDVTFSADRDGERGTLQVNGALMAPVNLEATNGVAHEIDEVLAPPKPDEKSGQ